MNNIAQGCQQGILSWDMNIDLYHHWGGSFTSLVYLFTETNMKNVSFEVIENKFPVITLFYTAEE